MSNFVYLGYKYEDVSFSITPEREKFYKKGVLGVRNYVLEGHPIEIILNPTNRNKKDSGIYYSAKAEVLPTEKQTEATIGTLYVAQMDEKGEKLSVEEVNMTELDNSHVIDLLLGTVFRIQHTSFGTGPHPHPHPHEPKRMSPRAAAFKK